MTRRNFVAGFVREPVDTTGPVPVWGNPGFLLNDTGPDMGLSRWCRECQVKWCGNAACWVCGVGALDGAA